MITLKESMASITISGTETVQFENGYYKYAAISNTGGSDIYVSAKNSKCTVPNDGVICIQPGASTVIRIFDAAFFISGEGTIQLIGQYDNRNPFKSAPTIDGGVHASGNPIQMDGLQGGVPFSEMVVSGKNLIAQPNWVEQSGGTVESNGITYTLNPDKSITANGTATDISYCALSHLTLSPNVNLLIKNTDYFFSGVPEGGGENTYNMYLNIYDENGTRVNIFVDHGSGVNVLTNKNYRCCAMITIKKRQTVNNLIFRPQLELGSSPTAYEPPITGRELTVGVSGKNLIPYPYVSSTKTLNGITFSDNGDGTITANGTATAPTVFYLISEIALEKGVYTLSGTPSGGSNNTYRLQLAKGDWSYGFIDIGNGMTKQITERTTFEQIRIAIDANAVCDNLVFRPQLEYGTVATDYEPYHGSTTTITPDSNPYTIPNDIRQQDGLNNISISEGELSVTGVRKNAAIKRIWDEIDEIKTAIIVSNGESE